MPFGSEESVLTFDWRDVSTAVAPSVDEWVRLVLEVGLEPELAHLELIDIPGSEKAAQAADSEAGEAAQTDPYDDPRIRRIIGLPPRSLQELEEDLRG